MPVNASALHRFSLNIKKTIFALVKNDLAKQGIFLSFLLTLGAFQLRLSLNHDVDTTVMAIHHLVFVVLCLLIWLSIIYVIQNLNIASGWQKAAISSLFCISLSLLFYHTFELAFQYFSIQSLNDPAWLTGTKGSIYKGLLFAGLMYPIAYYLEKQKEIQEERIELERLNNKSLLTHLGFLQQQMDSHFMFNSLSILRSGITDEWGKNYIVRLCNVYRYLLEQTQETNLIDVHKEVEFIESYIHLLNERFDGGVIVEIHLEGQILDRKIPPMALQTLVENAVKHNTTLTNIPLKIKIFSDQHHIVVKSDLHFKDNVGCKTTKGIGLQNLSERYLLIAKEPVVIVEDEYCLTVRIATI
ncbi:histidine kinase [Dyadobacter sp. LHD-138]|uniref:sensor histidine kinase n=1 Tax=Dyadobacter sp. LHD-138 TaxID=3071413 RepID=UPI0027DEC19A|nr:histidine kinase [Dyadobacter sp. LHD-138]MDQ6482049.1 histidine kinase [Dyadobacter sp. LHD-138]